MLAYSVEGEKISDGTNFLSKGRMMGKYAASPEKGQTFHLTGRSGAGWDLTGKLVYEYNSLWFELCSPKH